MKLKTERAKIFEYAHFDISALCNLASRHRQGQACHCDPSQTPMGGSLNWAIIVSFDDGIEWVFRSKRDDNKFFSEETNVLLLASETATLKYIRAHSMIPVPEVFAYR